MMSFRIGDRQAGRGCAAAMGPSSNWVIIKARRLKITNQGAANGYLFLGNKSEIPAMRRQGGRKPGAVCLFDAAGPGPVD